MEKRLKLQAVLEEILGSPNVYFQPPASVKMQYPAIVYKRKSINITHANDSIYRQLPEYEVILIDYDPDSVFVDKLLQLRYCRYDRHYAADNLNHDVFSINY